MPYLVDASNLGGVLAGAAGARDAGAVVSFLLGWSRDRGRVVAIFDGPERDGVAARYGALEIAWSGGRSADQEILARLGRGAANWIVVTDDRALASRSRALGARVESARTLAARVARPHPESPRGRAAMAAEKPELSPAELTHWREVFGAAADEKPPRRVRRARRR
jgi:hypothetical protein